jgi:prephenate dehydrogenase
MADVLVLGCGLIGTSVGLSLRGELDVVLHDSSAAVAAAAVARGGGRAWDGGEGARVVLVAVPPRATSGVLKAAQDRNLGVTYTHVASVQSQVQREIEALSCNLSSVVGGHPLAGRESSGPGGALGDLFVGRPWALCPSPDSHPDAVADVRRVAESCGAVPVLLDADAHDSAVALLSHLPQVVASALAGLLAPELSGDSSTVDPASSANWVGAVQPHRAGSSGVPTVLSGPGLVDTTRLAASDPALWAEILRLNAEHVAPAVRLLAERLTKLASALDVDESGTGASDAVVRDFLERGNRGRALVPVKRGEVSEAFRPVRVSVDDQPGRLAALLTAAGAAGVNVEDVHVEHIPGRPQGVIELLVEAEAVQVLGDALERQGWHVLGP